MELISALELRAGYSVGLPAATRFDLVVIILADLVQTVLVFLDLVLLNANLIELVHCFSGDVSTVVESSG